MYVINAKNEKVMIKESDTIENFESGGKEYDPFCIAAFVISILTLLALFYFKYSEGGERDEVEVSEFAMEPVYTPPPPPPMMEAPVAASVRKSSSSARKKGKKSKGRRY